jgi:glycosyltransferase involved in cell wall biosynthesis
MTISGFTLVRNGVKFDYPFMESIQSLFALCDEVVINVGISEDDTLQRIEAWKASLPPRSAAKVTIFTSEWPLNDPAKRQGGQILAEQTNLALKKCKGDWCLYLQADEVLHEKDYETIRADLDTIDSVHGVDALVFQYVHFYCSYGVIQTSRSSYRREIRAIRNWKGIWSVGDAQSFRYITGDKIQGVLTKARIFHYGWVRPPEVMKAKTGFMDTLYHAGADAQVPATGDNYKYKRFVGLKPFRATHPAIMEKRVQERSATNGFDLKKAPWVFESKDTWKILSGWIEAATGIRPFEFKNYRLMSTGDVKARSKSAARVLKRTT